MAVLAYLVNLAIVLARAPAWRCRSLSRPAARDRAHTAIMFLGSRYYVFCNPRPILNDSSNKCMRLPAPRQR